MVKFALKDKTAKTVIVFGLICFFTIFLRVYHFSDWLRFNSDQARDAGIVRDMIENNNVPLLGPIAGGTLFQLGPAFYYFQFVGAKLFGVMPDKMAYGDLLFGILSVPLAFFLFLRYFKKNTSLMLAALYATSFFAVQYSRFAWNPNSAQFFSMLFVYSILMLSDAKSNKIPWIVAVGISLGIGVQLHTLLLFGMPFAFFLMMIYFGRKKSIRVTHMIAILFIVFVLNITQVVSEIKTGGGNYLEFRKALVDKSGNQSSLWKNAAHVISCQIQSNAKILVPYVEQETCESPLSDRYFKKLDRRNDNFSDWSVFAGKIVIAVGFSMVGYFLLYRAIKNEKDEKRKKDLVVVAIFNSALVLLFVPFGAEISLRYFVLMTFVPFFLLGLIIEFLQTKNNPSIKYLSSVFVYLLIMYNLFFCIKTFNEYSSGRPGSMIDGTVNQVRYIAEYLVVQAGDSKTIQIGGQKVLLGRFANRVSYFTKESGIEVVPLNDEIFDPKIPLFVAVDEMSKKCEQGESYKSYGTIKKCTKFNEITIMMMN
ncbi:MAG: hypothetical protein US25_C0010G0003 [Candidatus Moranbacteria bacterium GW2011_GWE1_36_7]|nr:MAG: hypothetical protein US25_C0010G0003 [Candidatus Moranbacteria bacterium GW2011_GWE1_36_7]